MHKVCTEASLYKIIRPDVASMVVALRKSDCQVFYSKKRFEIRKSWTLTSLLGDVQYELYSAKIRDRRKTIFFVTKLLVLTHDESLFYIVKYGHVSLSFSSGLIFYVVHSDWLDYLPFANNSLLLLYALQSA